METIPSKIPSMQSGGTAGMLPAERARASFPVEDLRALVGGDRKAKAIAKYQPLFAGAPFDDQHLDDYASYAELFKKKIDRVTSAFRLIRENPTFLFAHMKQRVKMEDMFEHNGVFLHFTMMLNYIKSQGTKVRGHQWQRTTC